MNGIGIETETDFAEIKEINGLIKESVKRILWTRPRERVNNVGFGFGLETLLFKPESLVSKAVKERLVHQIETWEPRIIITLLEISILSLNKIKIVLRYVPRTMEFEEQEIILKV